ncbi:MAG TPA: hypothetical protein VGN04_12185 [Herbaspirillum sp.]
MAETEYFRRLRQQRDCEQECALDAHRLARFKSELPLQRAAILDELAERPVDVRQVNDAQSALRKLQHQLLKAESRHQALEESHRQACLGRDEAYRKYTAAMRRHQKFHEIKVRDDLCAAEQGNAMEQTELEDRPFSACSPI